jgi:anti-sigma factor RsiW
MAERGPSFEILSAYVDGELSLDEAAAVARWAASDSQVAAQVAALRSLRAGVHSMASDMTVIAVATTRPRHRLAATGALLGLGIVGMVLALLAGAPFDRPDPMAQETAQAIERHDQWLAGDGAAVRATSGDDGSFDLLMAASGLTRVHFETAPLAANDHARHSAFIGERGCRLSLFEIPVQTNGAKGRAARGGTAELTSRNGLLTARWQTAGMRFIMIARDMDPVRFSVIAAAMQEAGERRDAPDPAVIADLHDARRPCLT